MTKVEIEEIKVAVRETVREEMMLFKLSTLKSITEEEEKEIISNHGEKKDFDFNEDIENL